MFRRTAFIFLIWSFITGLFAQGQLHVLGNSPDYIPIDFGENIPEVNISREYIIVDRIEFEGNKATKQHVLLRELSFAQGDTLYQDELPFILEQSRENLLNTSLFNFVDVSLLFDEFVPSANVRFTFVERWYIWPFPIFEVAERNLNDWILNPNIKRTNYGVFIVKENFRGRMEKVNLLARFGYKQKFNFGYAIPYINRSQKIGVSFAIGMDRRNEIEYMTRENSQLFYSEEGGFALTHFYLNTSLFYRKGIYNRHTFSLNYNQIRFSDSLLVLNPLFSPGAESFAPFFSFEYEFKHDFRDIKAYPLNGHYFDVRLKKQGLGILPKEKMDISSAETSLRKFWTISPRWYFASGVNAKVSLGNFQPYYLQQGLGFSGDIVRGYENFVIDGQHFIVVKSNFKYALVPSRVNRIGFIGNEKFSLIHYAFYVNIFTDFGYVNDNIFFKNNPYSNTFLAGTGIGIDLVTYYDKVFRTEFSVTRQGDLGFYLHLIAPI